MTVVKYFDVLLITLAAPFVVAMGLPLVGYLAGVAVWTAQRGAAVVLEERARRAQDASKAVGITVAGSLGRAWLVGLTILAVGLAGSRDDGAMAAALVLVAFTVYFVISLLFRTQERSSARS